MSTIATQLVASFQKNIDAISPFDGSTTGTFEIEDRVRLGSFLALTVFRIYIAAHSKMFNLARLRTKTTTKSLIRRFCLVMTELMWLTTRLPDNHR